MESQNLHSTQKLNSLITDYKIFPQGSIQNYIQKEIIIAFCQRCQINIPQSLGFQKNLRSVDQIKKIFQEKMEPIPSDIKNILNKLDKNRYLYDNLCLLKSKILLINVLELERLTNKTKECEKLIDQKDVVLFIGNTGSGKSTAIIKFLGYNLKEGKVNNLSTLLPTTQLQEQHKTFYTSPEGKSCTRYINAAPFPDSLYPKSISKNNRTLVICDSPGFGDSAGVQVDIANGVGMINALRKARSVRIVVLLPYNSLTTDRLAGAINMGQIICNLVEDSELIRNFAILFNMVPKDKIQELSQLISNKIQNLNTIEKGNQKLTQFLQHILEKSKQEDNYYYPLQDNQKKIFQKIRDLDPITNVSNSFRYQFSFKTKKEIQKFYKSEQSMIKECIQRQNFREAHFHLKMLQKLKNILFNDAKIVQCYNQVAKFIQGYSDNLLTHYEQLMKSVINLQEFNQNEAQLANANKKVQQISTFFQGFGNISVVSKDKIKKMKEEIQKNLYNQCLDSSKINSDIINAIRMFSQIFQSGLKNKVGILMQKKYEEHFKNVKILLKQKKFEQSNKGIKILFSLSKYIGIIIGRSTIQTSASRSKELKQILNEQVSDGCSYIQQILKQQPLKMNQKILQNITRKIKNLRDIKALSFLDNNKQIEPKIIKYYQSFSSKCKQYLKDLQELKPFIDQTQATFQKQKILQKKRQIDLLIRMPDISEHLIEQYRYTLQNITRKNAESINKLKEFVKTLRNHSQSMYKRIDSIKNSVNIVIQYCSIVDQKYNANQIIEPIKQQFVEYLQNQYKTIKQIDVDLKNINELEMLYNKIKAFQKIEVFGQNIKQIVEQVKKIFIKKLKDPFSYFKQFEIPSIKGRHYKFITHSLEHLEKLSIYSFKMASMLTIQQLQEISSDQPQIINQLKSFVNRIMKDLQLFMDYSLKDEKPTYLTDLMKALIAISNTIEAKKYLRKNASFDIQNILNRLTSKLKMILQELRQMFQKSQKSVQKLEPILADCKYFSEKQNLYKMEQKLIGFNKLLSECQQQTLKILKNDEDRINQVLKNKPTVIDFSFLKSQLQRFKLMNNNEGKKRAELIQKGLKKIQKQIIQKITNIENENADNPQKKSDLLQVFSQLVVLQENLGSFYKNSQINKQTIKRANIHIINFYLQKFEELNDALQQKNMVRYKELAKSFGSIQTKIFRVLYLQKLLKSCNQQQQYLIQGINMHLNLLRAKIQQHKQITQSQKSRSINIISLKILIEILQKGVQLEIKHRYLDSSKLQIDKEFKNCYQGADIDMKEKFKKNIDQFMKKQQSSFIKDLKNSSQNAEKKKQSIKQIINLLPVQIKQKYNQSLQNLQIQNNKKIEEQMKKQAQLFAPDSNSFFISSKKLQEKGQIEIYKKYVKKFNEIYTSAQVCKKTVDQKLKFVQAYFIKLFQKQQIQLRSNQQMQKVFVKQFQRWHKEILMNQLKASFDRLNTFFGEPLTKESLSVNFQQTAQEIFKIYNYIISLPQMAFTDIKQLKNAFRDLFQAKIKICIETYNSFLEKKEGCSLSAQQIFTSQKRQKIKHYVKGLRQIGPVMQTIENEAHKTTKIEEKHKIKNSLKEQFTKLKNYYSQIEYFKKQIQSTKMFLKNFTFFNDSKRNMSPKELKEDLNKLNKEFKSFQQKELFFEQILQNEQMSEEATFTFKTIGAEIDSKFEKYVDESKKEVTDCFEKIDTEPISKINLLKSQLQIMREQQLSYVFIKKQKVVNQIGLIKNIIDSQFINVQKKIKSQLDLLKPQFKKMNSDLKKMFDEQRQKIKVVADNYRKICEQKSQKQRQKTEKALASQLDENKIKEIRNNEQTQLNSIENECQAQKNRQIKKIKQQFSQKSSAIKKVQDKLKNLCNNIIIFQKALIDIIDASQKFKRSFQQILKSIKDTSSVLLNVIQKNLQNSIQDVRSIGKYILLSYKNYFNFGLNKIKSLIKGQDITYVLQNLQRITIDGRGQMDSGQKNKILEMYNLFKNEYDRVKEEYQSRPTQATILYIASPLKELGRQAKESASHESKVRLLAGIFALWVILKSEKIETGEVQFTIEPHPTQITTLFLLLGITQREKGLSNRLAQVGTGEGKSIVLAGLCSYLALTGFSVKCACYSVYLSGRDQENFKELFLHLGVDKQIKYGTFNELCEEILNSNGNNLKEQVQKMILSQQYFKKVTKSFGQKFVSLERKSKQSQNPTILVIDEVDVFFQENFFGKTYCPAISLKDDEIKKLMEHIWNQIKTKGEKLIPSQIFISSVFKNLKKKYPTFAQLFQNQVHGMIAGALNYKHDYYLIDKKICYKDGDSISHTINYGYKTVFANLYEYEKGSVSQANLDKALQISLMFAEFSYAELPSYFQTILGVTGTLQVLPKYKKRLLADRYFIQDQYAIPSAFGINKKRVQKYVVTPQKSHQETIVDKIKQVKDGRPIIVFFKGPRELNEFANCSAYKPFMTRTYNLTEEHGASTRDSRIVNAVNPNNITLMSSAFGRGTDFVLLDDKINERGGLHVVHAFLSLEESQEVQIKGRTARQNSKGSYDCIISQNWLEQLNLKPESIQSKDSQVISRILFQARDLKIQKQSQSNLKILKNADQKHRQIFKVFTKPHLDQCELIDYICKLNLYPSVSSAVIKTILALDATGSMKSALKKTCLIIGDSFQRSYSVLGKKAVQAVIQVKIIVYRNYNSSHELILESTTFQNTYYNLKRFLQKVQASGGWGNEALQVLFQSLNKEQKIDQVILIGDAPANTLEEVKNKRAGKGQDYWVSKGFPKTNLNQQLTIFKSKKCPVHSFYLNDGRGFKEISQKTNGTASFFNIKSAKVTQDLADFIVQNILKRVEKNTGNINLVQTYRRMYMK